MKSGTFTEPFKMQEDQFRRLGSTSTISVMTSSTSTPNSKQSSSNSLSVYVRPIASKRWDLISVMFGIVGT